MSLFGPRFYNAHDEPSFSGLFRLIDDWDKYAQAGSPQGQLRRHLPTFTPKFDMKEVDDAYELHGELPGIEKKDLHIEFTDPQTIMVRGKVERSFQSGDAPAGAIEDAMMSSAITEKGESHKATVEEESEEGKPKPKPVEEEKKKEEQPKTKYWISERSVGEFSRSFSFPGRVDADNVKATLGNGILTLTVPKAPKHQSKRIDIN